MVISFSIAHLFPNTSREVACDRRPFLGSEPRKKGHWDVVVMTDGWSEHDK